MDLNDIPPVPPNLKDWLEVGASVAAIAGIFQVASGLFSFVAVQKRRRVDVMLANVRDSLAQLESVEDTVNYPEGREAFAEDVRLIALQLTLAADLARTLRDAALLRGASLVRTKMKSTLESAIAQSGAISDAGSDDSFEGDDAGSDDWASEMRRLVETIPI